MICFSILDLLSQVSLWAPGLVFRFCSLFPESVVAQLFARSLVLLLLPVFDAAQLCVRVYLLSRIGGCFWMVGLEKFRS